MSAAFNSVGDNPPRLQSTMPTLNPSQVSAPPAPVLQPGENVRAALAVDLAPSGQFADGQLLLTDRRLLAREAGAAAWQAWPLQAGMALHHGDQGGVGHLWLHDETRRLAGWRFTLGMNPDALALATRFEQQMHRVTSGETDAEDEAEPEETDFGVEAQERPSTWVLLRLWRFAHPYRWQLLAGFLLTLGSTAASLVPPYLTIPLMDDVLIPFQNGQKIDPSLVGWLLGGLLGASVLAWALGWARTWLLAVVSERIGADLRTETFEHLLRLSLDYFGAKRTGDLISRIGSESDRICVFLSLHALDFATDVIMIGMTAVILFSISPSLALVTLLPLPFIVWLIHLVRDRLRTGFEKIDRVWGEVTSVLADTIPGIRVVKAFAQERREADRFKEANRHNLLVNDKLNKVWSLFSPTVGFLTEVGLLVVWAFGIWLVSKGNITVGVLTAFIAYIGRFYGRLDSMSRIVSMTQKAAAGRQAHLRHPRPCEQRARTGPAGAGRPS